MDLPKRKSTRLTEYDYSQCGIYFITICTKNREKVFWNTVGASIARPFEIPLSQCGIIAEEAIRNIARCYPAIVVDKYVIMPNHIHLLIRIQSDSDGRPMVAPTISTVVQQMKGFVTKQLGRSVWQKLFYDHIVRNDADYKEIWNYIDNNPARWTDDRFYAE